MINLGNDAEMSILALAEKIKEITASDSDLSYQPLPEDDPRRRRPRLDKARAILGWEPDTGLEEGLRRVVEWFQANPA